MKFYILIIFILLNLIYSESDLLRSKYLTDDMLEDIEKLDKYDRKARKIFNKYEKAKFYQLIAYTYYTRYEELVNELKSLDRHYYSIFNDYKGDDIFISIDEEISHPGIQNEFTPILFTEDDSINIRLFRAKAKMFKKQYHDYLIYFNEKFGLYNSELIILKKRTASQNKKTNYSKIYNDYNNFLLSIESVDKSDSDILNVTLRENDLVEKISWSNKNSNYQRKFHYFNESDKVFKTVDFKDGAIILETIYNIEISEDQFLDFIISQGISNLHLVEYGNYSITNYNKFEKPIKVTYYSINNNIIGIIAREFEEDVLELVSESWYIGDYNKKIREFNNIFDPKSDKYIWIEEKYK